MSALGGFLVGQKTEFSMAMVVVNDDAEPSNSLDWYGEGSTIDHCAAIEPSLDMIGSSGLMDIKSASTSLSSLGRKDACGPLSQGYTTVIGEFCETTFGELGPGSRSRNPSENSSLSCLVWNVKDESHHASSRNCMRPPSCYCQAGISHSARIDWQRWKIRGQVMYCRIMVGENNVRKFRRRCRFRYIRSSSTHLSPPSTVIPSLTQGISRTSVNGTRLVFRLNRPSTTLRAPSSS